MAKIEVYEGSPNNSSTSLSDDDDGLQLVPSSYFTEKVAPAQWTSSLVRSNRPKTPPHSPASHLPPEVLIHVLRQIHTSRDIYAALLVSRAWCECAVEFLWHRPSFQDLTRFVQMLTVICNADKTFDYPRFIRRLNFISLNRELSDSLFVRLARCSKLERLTLVNCVELSDEALMRVLPTCHNLVALDLTNIATCTDRVIVALAQSATRLQGLNLGGCRNITDEGILAIAAHCPLIRRIKLSNVKNLTDNAVNALARQCPLLLEIDLHGCTKITDESVREVWTRLPQLRDFRLSQCADLTDLAFPSDPQSKSVEAQLTGGVQPFPSSFQIPSDGLPPLRLTRTCDHLRMLDLTSCALLTDDALIGIIANAPKIRNLYLSKCTQLTDVAVENICKLGKHLHYLHLGHASAITDKSVKLLARSCTRLRYIDLACCPLLTDMSVFELAGLPKLKRIGLVRVTNITDQAIFALADRHSTLERIHLSYCENITVLAIHFLLQRLTKLTHLSLTGVPTFRRQELQQFCRSPPREFNTNQRAAFCVYSNKGIADLRAYLAKLVADVHEDFTDETETDYDEEGDEQFRSSSEPEEQPDDSPAPENMMQTPRGAIPPRTAWIANRHQENPFGEGAGTLLLEESSNGPETEGVDVVRYSAESIRPVPSTVTTVRGRPARTIVDRERPLLGLPWSRSHDIGESSPGDGEEGDAFLQVRPPLVEVTNPSSLATTPSPTAQPTPDGTPSHTITERPRGLGFGAHLIVEAPTPSPQITPFASQRTISEAEAGAGAGAEEEEQEEEEEESTNITGREGPAEVPLVYERTDSNASDERSNRSVRSSGTNASLSNGAGFFRAAAANAANAAAGGGGGVRNINGGLSSGSDSGSARGGAYTPDLVFAEIGHGRGRDTILGTTPASAVQVQHSLTTIRSSSFPDTSSASTAARLKAEYIAANGSDSFLLGSSSGSSSNALAARNERSREDNAVPVLTPLTAIQRQQQQQKGKGTSNGEETHDPSSPIPYLSNSPTRELSESMHDALAGAFQGQSQGQSQGPTSTSASVAGSHHQPFPSHSNANPHAHNHNHSQVTGRAQPQQQTHFRHSLGTSNPGALIQDETDTRDRDREKERESTRGRPARRSLKSAFSSVAEHYANALFFRDRDRDRDRDRAGSGSGSNAHSTTSSNGSASGSGAGAGAGGMPASAPASAAVLPSPGRASDVGGQSSSAPASAPAAARPRGRTGSFNGWNRFG